MVDGPHACCNWLVFGHDCDPDVSCDHHMRFVSGGTCLALVSQFQRRTRLTVFALLHSDIGYDDGLSTLGMVSGMFGAFWSLG